MVKLINETQFTQTIQIVLDRTNSYTKKITKNGSITITDAEYEKIALVPKGIRAMAYNIKTASKSGKVTLRNSNSGKVTLHFSRNKFDKYSKILTGNGELFVSEEEFKFLVSMPKGVYVSGGNNEKPAPKPAPPPKPVAEPVQEETLEEEVLEDMEDDEDVMDEDEEDVVDDD